MKPLATTVTTVALVGLLGPAAVSAQPALQPRADVPTPLARGWVFTPSLAYGVNWDDNVLIQGTGDDVRSDVMNAVSPRGALDYRNKRTQVSFAYDGTILFYNRIGDLNAYDQRATASLRRTISKRLSAFAQNNLAVSPTTELTEIIGVPFARTGSQVNDWRSGIDLTLSRRASLTTAYSFQWVKFGRRSQAPDAFSALQGGHSHGGNGTYRYRLNPRTNLTGEYSYQRATLANAAANFDIQNGVVGVERTDSRQFTYSASAGLARLGISANGKARLGPAWRLSMGRTFERGTVSVGYSRSFVPSYGFGGTMQNEQLNAAFRAPLARRLAAHTSVAWRRNEPLTEGDPSLWSWWLEGGVAYQIRPWLHLDAFYSTDRQTIDRPGGNIARNRIGVQLATGRAIRIH